MILSRQLWPKRDASFHGDGHQLRHLHSCRAHGDRFTWWLWNYDKSQWLTVFFKVPQHVSEYIHMYSYIIFFIYYIFHILYFLYIIFFIYHIFYILYFSYIILFIYYIFHISTYQNIYICIHISYVLYIIFFIYYILHILYFAGSTARIRRRPSV